MEGSGSNVGIERVGTEQVIEGEATRNVLEKQLIRWAKRGDTTPSVLNVERLQFRNTVPVTVVAFDDGKPGQQINVLGDGQTTVNHNAKIIRAGAAAALLATGAVYTFTMWEDRVWHESQASGGGGGGGGGVTSFNTRAGAVVPVAGDYTPAFIGAVPSSHLTDTDPHTQYVLDSEKGAAAGVAQLDGSSLVPKAQLGTGTANATKFLRGDGTWNPAGAGGISVWNWDYPPAAPSGIDDEFNAALSGWTNVGAATTQAVAGGKLDMSTPGVTSASASGGIERALPAGNFSVITRVDVIALGAFSLCGIYVRSSVSGKFKFWSSQLGGAGNYRDKNISVCDYAAFNNRTAFGSNTLHTLPVFLRIDYDGTNLRFHFSFDGVGWILYSSITMVSYFSGGNLPDKVGLLVDPFSTTVTARAMFDFFRYYNAASANTGGFMGVA
jgi:hypothetical protein